MAFSAGRAHLQELIGEFTGGGRSLGRIWRQRSLWQVWLRWWVPPAIAAGLAAGRWIGFDVPATPILCVAAFILAYNVAFAAAFVYTRKARPAAAPAVDRLFAVLQTALDYTAMFLLIHFTGGAGSPLIFFFIFHVIFAAVLFRPSTAYLSATIAVLGMTLLATAEQFAWLPHHPVLFRGAAVDLIDRPGHVAAMLVFFAASVFIAAAATTTIMRQLRRRVLDLAEATAKVAELNEKLNSLYAMVRAVGSENRLDPVLKIATAEAAGVMDVPVVTVKLLSEDGKTLRYAAAHGLPADFTERKIVEVARSPYNRRVIEGETLVLGQLDEADAFQLRDDLLAIGIRSVLFAPLTVEERVIGIIGAYCRRRDCFSEDDVGFFRLAAELVAIAIESARKYEAIQVLTEDRTRFMLQVAHNMRAPLGAAVSMLEAVGSGYLGDVPPEQAAYLRRVDRRLRTMNETVNELLVLAQARDGTAQTENAPVDVARLARQVERTFREKAERKGLALRVDAPGDLPRARGDEGMLEQMLENLVSNAIKYTPEGGSVGLTLARGEGGTLVIEVRDTGIGIPREEQPRLFGEFFRASNAREQEEAGTGLGLAIVKRAVELHGGAIGLESEQGRGTVFTVRLPVME